MSPTVCQFQISDALNTNSLKFFNGVKSPGAFTFESGRTTWVKAFISLVKWRDSLDSLVYLCHPINNGYLCFFHVFSTPTNSISGAPITIWKSSKFKSSSIGVRMYLFSIASRTVSNWRTFSGRIIEPANGSLKWEEETFVCLEYFWVHCVSTHSHEKYWIPSTQPLCFPRFGSSHSMPYHSPAWCFSWKKWKVDYKQWNHDERRRRDGDWFHNVARRCVGVYLIS